MNKNLLIIVVIVGTIAGALYADEIMAIFHGMTVLESLKFVVQYVLHVTVITLAVYAVQTLPEIVKPWMRALRQQRRHAKRANVLPQPKASKGLTNDQLLRAYLAQQMTKGTKIKSQPAPSTDEVNWKL